jgi:WD40 repeat protein
MPEDLQPPGPSVRASNSGPVAVGGNVSIVGAVAAGRDIHIEQLTLVTDDGPPIGDQAGLPPDSLSRCPYPGITAFSEDESDLFFGRSEDTDSVLRLLNNAPLVAVVGSSGSGKSSLLAAAVAPAARAGKAPCSRRWQVVPLRPGPDPMSALATAAGQLRPEPAPLWLIDQFEEVFDAGVSSKDRAEFLDAVLALCERPAAGRVIVAIRSDFYPQLDAHPAFARAVALAQHRLVPLDVEAVEEAVIGPAQQVGLRVEPALLQQIRQEIAGNPASLPLLGFALRQTWLRRRNGWLTVAGYLQAGGIVRALEQGAQRSWSKLSVSQQQTAKRILLRLCNQGDGGIAVRRRRQITDLVTDLDDEIAVVSTVNALAAGRLLTVAEDGQHRAVVEIAHESLLREWGLLRDWLRQNEKTAQLRDELVEAVDDWESHACDPAYLLPAERLTPIRALLSAGQLDLTGTERRFLQDSTRRARGTRLIKRALPALVVVLLGVSALAGVAVRSQHRAEAARQTADALQLEANARSVIGAQRDLGTLLALAAYGSHPDDATLGTVIDSVAAHDGPVGYLHPAPHADALAPELSTTGAAILGMSDGTIQLRGAGQSRTLTGHQDAVTALVGFGAGLIASSDVSGVLLVHQEDQATPLVRLSSDGGPPVTAIVADSRRRLVVVASGRSILRYPISALARPLPTLFAPQDITSLALDSAADQLIAATRTGDVLRWRLDSGTPLPGLTTAATALVATSAPRLALDAAGELAAVDGDRLYLWRQLSTKPVQSSTAAPGAETVAWDPRSGQLLVAGADGRIGSWLAAGQPAQLGGAYLGLSGNAPPGSAPPAIATDGTQLVGLDQTGTLVRWMLGASTGPAVRKLDGIDTNELALDWSANGILATGGADGSVRVVDPRQPPHLVGRVPAPVGGVAWVDPSTLVVAAGDGALYSSVGGATLRRLTAPLGSPFVGLVRGPDSQLAAVTSVGALRVWRSGGQLAYARQLPSGAHSIAFSSTNLIAVGTGDAAKTVITVARTDGSGSRLLRGQRLQVDSLAFTPDGRTLASGSDDHSIALWSASSGQRRALLLGHTDMVQSLAFSADGARLASSGQDGTLRFWNVADRTEIGAPITAQSGFMPALAIAPDQQLIAVSNVDQVLAVPFSPQSWVRAGCALAARELSATEWTRYATGISRQPVCTS